MCSLISQYVVQMIIVRKCLLFRHCCRSLWPLPRWELTFGKGTRGQQLFSFQTPTVHWMPRTSSLKCLSCGNHYQTLRSLKASPLFTEKPLSSLKVLRRIPFPKISLYKNIGSFWQLARSFVTVTHVALRALSPNTPCVRSLIISSKQRTYFRWIQEPFTPEPFRDDSGPIFKPKSQSQKPKSELKTENQGYSKAGPPDSETDRPEKVQESGLGASTELPPQAFLNPALVVFGQRSQSMSYLCCICQTHDSGYAGA